MVDGGASDSEGSDISGIDEYIPDHFDGETDGFRHKFTLVLPSEGPGAKTIKKNTNLTQKKSESHRAKQYEVTSFLSTDCELSTETCSKNVYSLGPWPGTVPGCQTCLASRAKHDLKALTPTGGQIRVGT